MSGPKQLSNLIATARNLNSSNVPLETIILDASGNHVTSFGAGGTQYTNGDVDATITGNAILFDNGTNTVRVVSTLAPLPVNVVAGSAAGSTTVNVSSVAGVVLGQLSDRDFSTKVAAVLGGTPASTTYGLIVREAAHSTGPFAISSIAGETRIAPASTNFASSAGFHFDSSGGLQVTDVNPSTGPFAISSIAGQTRIAPASTAFASSAGFHFDSSGAMQVSVVAGGSTQVSVKEILTSSGGTIIDSTEIALRVNVVAGSAGGSSQVTIGAVGTSTFAQNSSAYLPVRLTDGTAFLAPGAEYGDGSTQSTVSAPALAFNNGTNTTMRIAGTTTPFPIQLRTSSGVELRDETLGALKITDVAPSTGPFAISSIAGQTRTAPASTNWASSAGFHFDSSGGLHVTDVNVSTGPFAISSIAGQTRIAPASTTFASSAGFHFDSSGAMQVSVVAGGSTQVSVKEILTSSGGTIIDSTEIALRVNVVAGSAAGSSAVTINAISVSTFAQNSSAYLPVRLTNSTAFLSPGAEYGDADAPSTMSGPALAFHNSSANTMRIAGSSTPFPIHVRTSSGADCGDAVNTAVRVNVVAGGGGGTADQTAFSSGTTTISAVGGVVGAGDVAATKSGAFRMSSVRALWTQPVDSSGGVMTDSTERAIRVNVVAGSAGGSSQVTIGAVGVSTFAQNSSAYLPIRVSDGSSFLSGALEYTDGSTVSTYAGPALLYNNSSNDTMRLVGVTQPFPVQMRTGTLSLNSTTVVITSTASTAVYALVSSAASVRHKVFAFHVTSTHTRPSTLVFMSSGTGGNAGHDLWHVGFGSGSSGMTGANLAVSPPAFLFASVAANALNVRIEEASSATTSTQVARVSFSYFTEA